MTLLYLSKRLGSNDISLVLHAANSSALADFITSHLAKLSGVDGLWLIIECCISNVSKILYDT
ncbi:MAG: hypothetical protein HY757_03180 [Nitrospirae bacterium]|nr:hypothetical protein [Nitrospirota bacterium]